MNNLTIIYYHEVVKAGKGLSYQKIEEDKFEKQMKFLQDNGYHSLTFDMLKQGMPEKAVIVSFDDGFRTVYENAFPVMKRYGIVGNVYLPTAYIGKIQNFLTWDMVQELLEAGWYFAAHTHTHMDIRRMDEVSAAQELTANNFEIEKRTGYIPEAFCIPYGGFNRNTVNLVRRMGQYRYMLGSFYGTVHETAIENRVLPRIGISNDDSLELFEKKLQGKMNWKGPLQRGRLLLQNIRKQTVDHYDY